MSFLDKLDKYLILPNWLQFVGFMLAAIATGYGHGFPRLLGFVGLGVAAAGRLYNEIYP